MGISTSTPLTKLHILGGQDAGLPNTSNGYLMLGSGTSTNLIFDNNEIMARNNGSAAPLTPSRSTRPGRALALAAEVGRDVRHPGTFEAVCTRPYASHNVRLCGLRLRIHSG